MLHHLAQTYSAWLVGALLAIESSGIPVPGETTLVASAIYAGTTPNVSIWLIIAAAVAGAVIGNLIGYAIGRLLGYRLLIHYGSYVRLPEPRLKIGEYLFSHYGIAVVLLARFVPLLRSIAPLVAGANRMPMRPFLTATVAGAVAWVMFDSLAAYYFGKQLIGLSMPAMVAAVLLAALVIAALLLFVARHEKQLQAKAEREFPGPLPER